MWATVPLTRQQWPDYATSASRREAQLPKQPTVQLPLGQPEQWRDWRAPQRRGADTGQLLSVDGHTRVFTVSLLIHPGGQGWFGGSQDPLLAFSLALSLA